MMVTVYYLIFIQEGIDNIIYYLIIILIGFKMSVFALYVFQLAKKVIHGEFF